MGGKKSRPAAPPSPVLLEKDWRKTKWGDKPNNLQFLRNYQPHNDEVPQLRILLHGPTDSGKSSFFNSVDSVLQGRITGQALADANSKITFTIKFKTFNIQKGGPGTLYPFAFTDIMGIEKDTGKGVNVEDIKLAMKGHIKDGYNFNPQSKISEDDQHFNRYPALKDQVHALVCVIDANTSNLLDAEYVRKMREVRLAARDIGIPQMAILTKIDDACPEVKRDIRNVYKSKLMMKRVEEFSAALGIPKNCIFPVKNYDSEIYTDDDTDDLILSALTQMIHLGEDYVNGNNNQ